MTQGPVPAPDPAEQPRPGARAGPARRRARVAREALAPAVARARGAAEAGGLAVSRPASAREVLTTALKAALAAGLAWQAARVTTGEGAPVFAPLTALLAVQLSVRRSLREVLPRLLGLLAGVVVAVLVAEVLPLNVVAVVLIVVGSVLAGGLLRLPAAAAAQVPVTGLLLVVLGGGGVRAAELRLADGVIGLLVGVALNALVAPPLGLDEARTEVRRAAHALADLLADLAVGLPGATSPGDARRWLQRARALDASVDRAAGAVADAADAHRWNPRGRPSEMRVVRLQEAVTALSHVTLQVRGVCRTVADAVVAARALGTGPGTASSTPGAAPAVGTALPDGYRQACSALASAVQAFADLVDADETVESPTGLRLVEAVLEAAAAREALSADVLSVPAGPDAMLLHGSLLADLRRAARELDPLRGEHRAAVRPVETPSVDGPAPG